MAGTDKDGLMNVTINIERLVLDGISIPYHQQPLLQRAVETELRHLCTDSGLVNNLKSGGAVPYFAAGNIQVADENDPNKLGQKIAQAVYERLDR
jgi:hypothetical protein